MMMGATPDFFARNVIGALGFLDLSLLSRRFALSRASFRRS
jgi:hypothetical protein